jgi:hypothetical protein
MQSENFDKKIKDSLSQRPPGYDSPDWDKMETLLDKHMPVDKKDRRRIFFILFSFLLLGGGAFLVWQNSSSNKKELAEIKSPKENSASKENAKPGNTGTNTSQLPTNEADRSASSHSDPKNNVTETNIIHGKEIQNEAGVAKEDKNKKTPTSVNKKTINSKQKKPDQTIDELVKNTEPERTLIEDLTKSENEPTITEKKESAKEPGVEKAKTENKVDERKVETEKTETVTAKKNDNKKQKNNSSFANNFFISVSAGPDLSKVGDNTGEVRAVYGAGIGYQISKKFSVRTGFYAARKVYTADPGDYHPPNNFWGYYPNLENIEANCKVYDIPVTVDYTISSNKKQSWFASVGLSSLLMKEETYDYYFKPNYSPTYITYTKTINNQNKHYFSVLNLSGGYTRVLNKNISLQAEPYLKIALDGVGYGKVKLNSGGVLFSAVIKPFAKK